MTLLMASAQHLPPVADTRTHSVAILVAQARIISGAQLNLNNGVTLAAESAARINTAAHLVEFN